MNTGYETEPVLADNQRGHERQAVDELFKGHGAVYVDGRLKINQLIYDSAEEFVAPLASRPTPDWLIQEADLHEFAQRIECPSRVAGIAWTAVSCKPWPESPYAEAWNNSGLELVITEDDSKNVRQNRALSGKSLAEALGKNTLKELPGMGPVAHSFLASYVVDELSSRPE